MLTNLKKKKKLFHFGDTGIFESIYFCNLNLSAAEQLEYVSKPKSVICQEIGVDVLIDDCLEHAFDVCSLGIDVLLYDRKGKYSWNHEDVIEIKTDEKPTLTSTSKRLYQHHHMELSKNNNIHRMFNWREIIAQFPKPSSPLRFCYYPNQYEEEEDGSIEEEDEDDQLFDHPYYQHDQQQGCYETVEVEEMSEEEEDSDYPLWRDNRVWV
jgi:hypothetical protein